MRLALITAVAACAFTLSACNRDTDTADESLAAEDVATDASATAGPAGAGYTAGAIENTQGATTDYSVPAPTSGPTSGPSQETRDNAKAEAEQTNLRPRPDVTGGPQ